MPPRWQADVNSLFIAPSPPLPPPPPPRANSVAYTAGSQQSAPMGKLLYIPNFPDSTATGNISNTCGLKTILMQLERALQTPCVLCRPSQCNPNGQQAQRCRLLEPIQLGAQELRGPALSPDEDQNSPCGAAVSLPVCLARGRAAGKIHSGGRSVVDHIAAEAWAEFARHSSFNRLCRCSIHPTSKPMKLH